ncbi:MAG: Gfo/Idh/MocA family oxidoreductase [Chloroflexota bacterium]|nr:Gfo/Idh/MocA family oxidoreductase [Chloroflexota bacterium]
MRQPLRVGLIGAGGISRAHARAYRDFPERVQLVSICDIDPVIAEQRARDTNVESIYSDPFQMLNEAAIDAVDICTPHDQHAPLAIAAAQAGKHVLVEKPMACSLEECRAMVAAAEQAGVTLMVAQHERYIPSYRGAQRAIQAGELGPIRAVRIDAMQNLLAFLPRGHWLYDGERAGGGIVISVAVHRIDLVRYLVGNVGRVMGVCRTMRPEFVNGAEDFACATLEFENGAIGELFATYSGYRMPWGQQFMIFGDDGTVHAVPPSGEYDGPALIASRERGQESTAWNEQFGGFVPIEPDRTGLPTDNGFVNEILHFAECCQQDVEPLTSGRDNLDTMKVIFGIYQSARTGQPVDLVAL